MKLRIRSQSLRLRLTQTEVNQIASGKNVTEEIWFGENSSALKYSLKPSSEVLDFDSQFDGQGIQILIKLDLAKEWASTSRVSLNFQKKLSDEKTLTILIEKDFLCLKPRTQYSGIMNEDDSDMFPNPNLTHGQCQ